MIIQTNRTDRRIRRTKSILKKALISLMEEKDYSKITVTDIIAKADYNRTTFYRHYKYKEELVEELIKDMVEGFIQAFRYAYKSEKYLDLDTLSSKDIVLFDYIADNAVFYKLCRKSEGIPDLQEKYIETIYKLLKEDIVHLSDQQKDINQNLFVTYRAHGIWGLIISWINSDFSTPSEQMAKQLIQILNYNPLERYVVK